MSSQNIDIKLSFCRVPRQDADINVGSGDLGCSPSGRALSSAVTTGRASSLEHLGAPLTPTERAPNSRCECQPQAVKESPLDLERACGPPSGAESSPGLRLPGKT